LPDQVSGDWDSATLSDVRVTVGSGSQGTLTDTASGTYSWDQRTYSYSGSSATPVTLSGPWLGTFYPPGAANGQNTPGGLVWSPDAALGATSGKLWTPTSGVLLGGASGLIAAPPSVSLMLGPLGVPLLAAAATPRQLTWSGTPMGLSGYGFAGEPLGERGIAAPLSRQDFDSYKAVELELAGLVDRAHTPLS
jgi:hypothetical protein